MTNTNPIVQKFNVEAFDKILARGLCEGVGDREGKMCIEAAICTVLDLPHGDDPGCVAEAVRKFKITLNDSPWSSDAARAKGLRDLGLAQLGSLGVVDDVEFATRMAFAATKKLVPKLFREIFKDKPDLLAHADKCEAVETLDAASYAASYAARAASDAARAASYAARAARAASYAARAASDAARAASDAASDAARAASDAASYAARAARADEYLTFVANLALEVLIELKSPGCELLAKGGAK